MSTHVSCSGLLNPHVGSGSRSRHRRLCVPEASSRVPFVPLPLGRANLVHGGTQTRGPFSGHTSTLPSVSGGISDEGCIREVFVYT